jgi:uncharacterized protein
MSIIKGIDKSIGDLQYIEVFGEKYLFGHNTLACYKIKNSNTKLLDLLREYTISNADRAQIQYYFRDHDEILSVIKSEYKSTPFLHLDPVNCNKSHDFASTNEFKSLTLVVTQSCNMSCKYCYEDKTLKFGGSVMSCDIAIHAIDFLFEHSEGSISISYFGGEPLLNFSVVKRSTEYAAKKALSTGRSIEFDIVTNGTIASNIIIEFLRKHNFKVGISLDGPKDIHDSNRLMHDGSGTYDTILLNIDKYFSLLAKTNKVKILTTLHHTHYERVDELYAFFLRMEETTGITFSLFGKINYVEDRCNCNTVEHYHEYLEMVAKYVVNVYMECVKHNSLSPIYDKARIDPQYFYNLENKCYCKKSLCSSGTELLNIYPDGSVAACRQLDPAFYPKAIWGSIADVQNAYDEYRLEPSKMAFLANQHCKKCWANNVCAGSCPGINYYYGDIFRPANYSCEVIKTMLMLSIWLRDKLKEIV